MRAFSFIHYNTQPNTSHGDSRIGWLCHLPAMRSPHHIVQVQPAHAQNERPHDKIGATPHPPAVFGSEKFFSFIFLQTGTPARAAAGVLVKVSN